MNFNTKINTLWEKIYSEEKNPIWSRAGTDPIIKSLSLKIISKSLLSDIKVLDIGCGNGRNSIIFNNINSPKIDYYGLDFSRSAIDYCKSLYPDKKFFQIDITRELDKKSFLYKEKYDLIIDHGCLHAIAPEFRKAYVKNILKFSNNQTRYILGTWYRNIKSSSLYETQEPDFVVYAILNEWFLNSEDIKEIFSENFIIEEQFVDKTPPHDIHNGMLYSVLKRKN